MTIPPIVEKVWRDPVWSNVIASAILGLFGIIYWFFSPATPSAKPVPQVVLALKNSSTQPIAIFRRGDFILWLPEGIGGVRKLPGRYDLDVTNGDAKASTIVVAPKASVRVDALLYAEKSLRTVLDSGVADLEFILRKERGGVVFSGSIPFSEQTIERTHWTVDLASDAPLDLSSR